MVSHGRHRGPTILPHDVFNFFLITGKSVSQQSAPALEQRFQVLSLRCDSARPRNVKAPPLQFNTYAKAPPAQWMFLDLLWCFWRGLNDCICWHRRVFVWIRLSML
jgi:hypothetical protein